MNKIFIPAAIFTVGVLIAGAVIFINKDKFLLMSLQEAADKAIGYIDEIAAAAGETEKASLNSVEEEKGVYVINFNIGENAYKMYVSKDGKYLFPGGYDMTVLPQSGK